MQFHQLRKNCLVSALLLLGQVLFGLALAADVEILAEKNGVHDGLGKEPDNEPHH